MLLKTLQFGVWLNGAIYRVIGFFIPVFMVLRLSIGFIEHESWSSIVANAILPGIDLLLTAALFLVWWKIFSILRSFLEASRKTENKNLILALYRLFLTAFVIDLVSFIFNSFRTAPPIDWDKIPIPGAQGGWSISIFRGFQWLLKTSHYLGFWENFRTTGLATLLVAGLLYSISVGDLRSQ